MVRWIGKHRTLGHYYISFYGDYTHARRMVKFLKQFNRPLINTEWMHNLYHADFTPYDQEELDILKKCNEDKNIWK